MEHFYYDIQETAHSFDKYLLSACYVPGIALYAGKQSPCLLKQTQAPANPEVKGALQVQKTNFLSKPHCTF